MAKKKTSKQEEPKEPLFDFNSYHFEIQHKFKLTKKQIEVLKVAQKPETKMIIIDGVAGTGKTLMSMLIALEKLRDKKVEGITSFRSTILAGDAETGYLPGSWEQKGDYIGGPFQQKLKELLKQSDAEVISKHLLDFLPSSFIRSYSYKEECLILSEAQNNFFESILAVATRAGEGSFVVVEGDTIHQNDLGRKSGFKKFCEMFGDEESQSHGIYYFHFGIEDIVRSEFVKYLITKRLKEGI